VIEYQVKIEIVEKGGKTSFLLKEYEASSPDDVCDLVAADMKNAQYKIRRIVPAEGSMEVTRV